jgi:glycosyltransferase involved in cell wall biosynthesis
MTKVSVILTSFNHGRFIRESIESVLNQTFEDLELIVWDDASSDGSWDIIQSYRDSRVKAFQNERNKGPAFGVNKAISEIALGEYIAITHSDDAWLPEKLERQVAFLESNPNVGAVFTWVQAIDENGVYSTTDWFNRSNQSRWKWLCELFNEHNHLNHPSVLIRKACYDQVGVYSDTLAQIPDAEMWVRLLLAYSIHVIPEALTLHRLFSDQRNTSGARPEVVVRLNNEWNVLRENFLRITSADEVHQIFSDLPRAHPVGRSNIKFLLAMACLKQCENKSAWQLGLRWLFELVDGAESRKEIYDSYGFSYLDFIGLSGKYDVYSVGEIHERDLSISALRSEIGERDELISALRTEVQDLSGQLIACDEGLRKLRGHWGVRFLSLFIKDLLLPR